SCLSMLEYSNKQTVCLPHTLGGSILWSFVDLQSIVYFSPLPIRLHLCGQASGGAQPNTSSTCQASSWEQWRLVGGAIGGRAHCNDWNIIH
uniref:Uncharacterized protein n=1 Tax=Salmo trutta TaxID=8032 RepID=A0A674A9U6_SALTR